MNRLRKRPHSLRSLVFIHEIVLLMLLLVTCSAGGVSAWIWQKNSVETLRIRTLISIGEQIRGEIYAQVQEMIRMVVLNEPNDHLKRYFDYSESLDDQFNQLRRLSESREEDGKVQILQQSYRQVQNSMNQLFRTRDVSFQPSRITIISPIANDMMRKFEEHREKFRDLLQRRQKELDQQLRYLARIALLGLPLLLAFAAFLVFYSRRIIDRGFISPLSDVMQSAQRMSGGDLDVHIREQGVVEVSTLAHTLNAMAEKLRENRKTLLEQERQSALGSLVPVVAHNVRNPLASIRATAQLIDPNDSAEEIKNARETILSTIDRLSRWVNALVSYLHPLKPHLRLMQASALVHAVLELMHDRIREKRLKLVLQNLDIHQELEVDPDLMEQALYSLLSNAVDACPKEGRLCITLQLHEDRLEFHIIDSGSGLHFKPGHGKLEPGPSTKKRGTGLGIPIALKICEKHGWELQFRDSSKGGAHVVVSAPLTSTALEDESFEIKFKEGQNE